MTTSAQFLTRFAPSPSGFLHLGNTRTALFNWLSARANGGIMLLRIEDTDSGRTADTYIAAIAEDLEWLGLTWQETHRQSQNTARHQAALDKLIAQESAYPCFCTAAELEAEREQQRKAGKPPRYSGKCAALDTASTQAKMAALPHAIRFRMPKIPLVLKDVVRGEIRFDGADIGDFIVRRTNGTFSFFFANAVDDAADNISLVLRGEDHLSNTPRQIALQTALGYTPPKYGHLPLMRGGDGGLLSKRDGALSLRDLRDEGFLPEAILNYLARVGCALQNDSLLSPAKLAAEFSLMRINNSPAGYDKAQLHHRQKEAVKSLTPPQMATWLAPILESSLPKTVDKGDFCAAVGENIALFADAVEWVNIVAKEELHYTAAAKEVILSVDKGFYATAATMLDEEMEWKGFCQRVGQETNTKGRGLFMPLRVALTGRTDGPAMPGVFKLIGFAVATMRFRGLGEG